MTKGQKKVVIKPEVDDEVTDVKSKSLRKQKANLKVLPKDELALKEDLKNFNIKSEHAEKNIKARDLTEEERNQPIHTQVTVYEDNEIQNVDPSKLQDYIKSNKRIKKVVIEKISVDDAERISMIFKEKAKAKLIKEDTNHKKREEFESILNIEFFNEEEIYLEDHSSESNILDFNAEEMAILDDVDSEKTGELNFSIEDDQIVDEEVPILNIDSDESDIEDDYEEFEEVESSHREKPPKKKLEKKVLKEIDQEIEKLNQSSGALIEGDEELKDKKLSYDRHTLTRKKGNTHNGYYYRAKDHMELFKVGSSYMSDFKNGLKSISFVGEKIKVDKEKSVFGVLSYFNYHIDISVCVVTPTFLESFYHEFIGDLEYDRVPVTDEDFDYKIYTGQGFDILEFSELKKVERRLRHYDFEYFLDMLIEKYDLILWDLPEVEILNSNKELYFPIVRSLDNVTVIVGENVSKFSEVGEVLDYFKRYQIHIKGVLVSKKEKENNKK